MTMPNTATCRLGITLETLSALRDHALDESLAQPLRAHIPTCPACQARLAAFDRVARALSLQRDLEPNQQIWAALQPHVLRKERSPMSTSRRSIISGAIAVISVAIVVALFALVLLNHHSTGTSTSVVATKPPSQTTTPPTKPTPLPTATPISLNGLPSPQQTWGTGAVQATVNIGTLHVAGITADGQHILGYQLSADGKNYDVGWLTIATHVFTTFDQSPVLGTHKMNNPPNCCVTDGRFVVGGNGISEGASTNIPWYYDTQTGQLHSINSNEFAAFGINNGVVYHMGLSAAQQQGVLYALHLLTGVDTPVPGTASIFNTGTFAWPNFTYTSSSDGGNTYALHIHNLQTNVDIALTSLGNVEPTLTSVALLNDALFFVQSTGPTNSLEEWDQIFTVGSSFHAVTSFVGNNSDATGANGRVVLIADSDATCQTVTAPCNYSLAWDRTLQKLVLLSPSHTTDTWLNGAYFLVVDHATNQATIFDATTFPAG
jgi:hypothetical protein